MSVSQWLYVGSSVFQSLWLDQRNAQAVPRIDMLKEGFSFYVSGVLFADGCDS